MHWLKLELSIISPPKTESFERCERNPLMSEVSLSNTMPCISIYIWWMHKWVKTSPTKFDSNTAKLLVADYVWMRLTALFRRGHGKYHKATLPAIPKCWIQKSWCSPVWPCYRLALLQFFFNCLVWFYCLWSITCTASTLKPPKSFSKFNHKGVTEKMSIGQVERPEWVEATLTAMTESQRTFSSTFIKDPIKLEQCLSRHSA